MNWLNEELAAKWRSEGKRYASEINEYVRIGMETDWKQNQKEPEYDQRHQMSSAVVKMIRAANKAGDVERLRRELPPATWPITHSREQELQAIRPTAFIKDGGVIVHTAAHPGTGGSLYLVYQDQITEISGLNHIGCSPDGNYFALVNQEGIRIVRELNCHFEGEETAFFAWENIKSSIKASLANLESLADEEHPECMLIEAIPYGNGKKVLLVSDLGIYTVESEQAKLIHPDISEFLEDDDFEITSIAMAHGAVSPDERWIAYGSQCSEHLLRDLTDGTEYSFAPESSYPHFSLFSRDSREVWYNSCHFYNGVTIRVPVSAAGQGTAEDNEEWDLMDEEMRVYAAVALENGHILGDANGYLRYINREGQQVWRHFVGSTISGMVLSTDEAQLAVGTYGGMLHFIDLNSGVRDEYTIGTADISETSRWILWRNEEPVRW
ncbi:hypothetical protein [Paenibacillus marinisediminis]